MIRIFHKSNINTKNREYYQYLDDLLHPSPSDFNNHLYVNEIPHSEYFPYGRTINVFLFSIYENKSYIIGYQYRKIQHTRYLGIFGNFFDISPRKWEYESKKEVYY